MEQQSEGLKSFLPREMEAWQPNRSARDREFDIDLDPDNDAPPPLPVRPPSDRRPSPPQPTISPPPPPPPSCPVGRSTNNMIPIHTVDHRASASALRNAFRSNNPQSTIRTVTPEPQEHEDRHGVVSAMSTVMRSFGSRSPQASSPRSIPGREPAAIGDRGGVRRQGVVFSDAMADSFDSTTSSSPPPRSGPFRPRTHTVDGAMAFRQQQQLQQVDTRQRVGSVSTPGSVTSGGEDTFRSKDGLKGALPLLSTPQQQRPPDLKISHSTGSASKSDRKSASRRLIKRTTSRPTSPLIAVPPSVDSLALPVPTDDANKLLVLMKTLCGRMKGDIEYQVDPGRPWFTGMSYIDEEKGSLMFDSGESGPFHSAIIPDLRGCRVIPSEWPDRGMRCLELSSPQSGVEIVMRPLLPEEFDLWLAALLCWQQLRPGLSAKPVTAARSASSSVSNADRPEIKHQRRVSAAKKKDSSIIKVGKVMVWDKGLATSPRAIVKRSSTRDLRSSQLSWRRVSCILQGNGEFKLMTENDVAILSIIDMSQLTRCAVQQLDKSVLDEEYCIAIFPIYSSTSKQLSIFRPVYIALDSRVAFEVWFVLLRAFAVPEIYGLDPTADTHIFEITNIDEENPTETFRVEKTLNLRVTEAKIRSRIQEQSHHDRHDRHGKNENDAAVGNYVAEVVLDGEVRARTTTKPDTKNPFWREDCEFVDLPSTLPCLSVQLKRVDGNLDSSFAHSSHSSLAVPKQGNLSEALCGSVEVFLGTMERGKDHEQWLQIYDDRQQSIGSMLVKVHHEELVVLPTAEYLPLLELLQKFGTGLTAQIAAALPGNLRRLSEIFLNIFQVSGNASNWLMALVEDEVDGVHNNSASINNLRFTKRLKSTESVDSASDRKHLGKTALAGEANLLFRGNTLLTQSLEFHMRRLGKEYLEEVLSDKIFEINESNPSCEVDPSRIPPGEDINKNWDQLIQLTSEVWGLISASAQRFPPELRHILKYVRAVAEDRYGDFLRTVSYTSVSGFLFLRFICPAVLNPKLFGLLRDHPRPRAHRALTLMAKSLQALANLSTIGKKEVWMEPMNNRFLNGQRQAVKDYIDAICDIPAERTTVALPASYSTPITILGRLPAPAREGFPSLPYLIDHPRNFAALVKLWTDTNPNGVPDKVVAAAAAAAAEDGDEDGEQDILLFHEVCAPLQQRANECFAHIEALRLSESSSQVGDDIADMMDHTTLADSVNLSYGSSPAWNDDASSNNTAYNRPPGSSGSEMDDRSRDRDRWTASLPRQASGGSEVSGAGAHSHSGTMRSLRNGKHARKFLSGFMMKKGRNASPDPAGGSVAGSSPAMVRESSRDNREGKNSGNRFGESWGSGSMSMSGGDRYQ